LVPSDFYSDDCLTYTPQLAYDVYPEGCILITDGGSLFFIDLSIIRDPTTSATAAMKILDPHLKDGVHEWRDGQRFVKEGAKLYLEGTDTLAGRCVFPFSLS
jgi:N-acetylglucosamine-6-phosphate deacetylase